MKSKKICIIGAGYVGISLGCVLATRNIVNIFEIDDLKISKINNNESPIEDSSISNFLAQPDISLSATNEQEQAYQNASFFIIALPTNFDESSQSFDTSLVMDSIKSILQFSSKGLIVIKSTVPAGFTKEARAYFKSDRIIFSPEFLREGSALEDNLYPSRIIVGNESELSQSFLQLLEEASLKKPELSQLMTSEEAEVVKLFSNTFLAMRIAFFNELDSYSMINSLNSKNVIHGVSGDPRIGNFYNNPSFGYGGYCLPKDTRQLLKSYDGVPQTLMDAIVTSNTTRIKLIADIIIAMDLKVIGVYRLSMKKDSMNSRSSSVISVIEHLEDHGIEVIIFEPDIINTPFNQKRFEKNLEIFKRKSDLILCNRNANELLDVKNKVFTRDIFNRD